MLQSDDLLTKFLLFPVRLLHLIFVDLAIVFELLQKLLVGRSVVFTVLLPAVPGTPLNMIFAQFFKRFELFVDFIQLFPALLVDLLSFIP